jgi:hypothetical protein
MKKYILIMAVFLAIGNSGCKKDYLSLETNPNAPSTTTPALTIAGALNNAAFNIQSMYITFNVWGGYWTQSGNFVPNTALNQYQIVNSTIDGPNAIYFAPGPWATLYQNLTDFNNLQKSSSASAVNANFEAIAMIMKAYDFELLVDNYNNVPYSQAFQPSTILFPAYDKGADIYHDLGKQLDAAIDLINKNPTAASPGGADIVFAGNMTSWKKFANSIKLRLAIHVSTNTPGDPLVTDLASTAGEGYLDENLSATSNPGYVDALASSGVTQQNPFWALYGLDTHGNPAIFNPQYRANSFAVGIMSANNDPRLSQFYAPITGNGNTVLIQGNIFGNTTSTLLPNTQTSAFGPGILQSPTQDAILFSGAESLFLQAEAALNGYITGNPQTLYQRGIIASFEQVQAGGTYTAAPGAGTPQTPGFNYTAPTKAVSDAAAVTYYSQNKRDVSWTASPNKQEAIIFQKWLALNGLFPLEAYDEYWRTGFPSLPPSVDPAAISTTLPKRVFYPVTEFTSNTTNVEKEGTIDIFTSKIFWFK